jgi:hypothetical protein
MRLEGLGQLKKCNNLIGIGTRDIPACSIVPQPTTLSCASTFVSYINIVIILYTFINSIQNEFVPVTGMVSCHRVGISHGSILGDSDFKSCYNEDYRLSS